LLFAENLLNERIALFTGQLRIGFFFVSHRDQPRGIIRLEQKRCKWLTDTQLQFEMSYDYRDLSCAATSAVESISSFVIADGRGTVEATIRAKSRIAGHA
jgi:hypothetical protein